jgi:hypothetical protein
MKVNRRKLPIAKHTHEQTFIEFATHAASGRSR